MNCQYKPKAQEPIFLLIISNQCLVKYVANLLTHILSLCDFSTSLRDPNISWISLKYGLKIKSTPIRLSPGCLISNLMATFVYLSSGKQHSPSSFLRHESIVSKYVSQPSLTTFCTLRPIFNSNATFNKYYTTFWLTSGIYHQVNIKMGHYCCALT